MASIPITDTEHKTGSKHQFGLIFSHAAIGIIVTDSEGTIINFNKYAEKQFGYNKKEVLGKKIALLISQGYNPFHIPSLSNLPAQPVMHHVGGYRDLFATKKDGTRFPVEISLSPYLLDGETFVIVFIVDITIRKNYEDIASKEREDLERTASEITLLNLQLEQMVDARTRMLQEALTELERSKDELSERLENEKNMSELKSKFVTLASHEFRTPLSTILSSAFLLEKYNDLPAPEQRIKHIKRIKSSVMGLKNILDEFLSVGKLEEGKIKSVEQEINSAEIHELIREITEDMEQLLKPSQRIVFECHSYANIKIDTGILKNIMINLVSNAIKFSGENKVINIICSTSDKELLIAVKDEGIGISSEDLNHLSERFFRAGNATNTQGTGLGLHIVMKYLELIGGRMEIQSELNKGSCFTIRLPLL